MMVAADSVSSTGPSRCADESVAVMCSTTDVARMAVTAAVDVSGPPTAVGKVLPSATTTAMMAVAVKVAAIP